MSKKKKKLKNEITLRDFFAGVAMAGFIGRKTFPDTMAIELGYKFADEVLNYRNKEKGSNNE